MPSVTPLPGPGLWISRTLAFILGATGLAGQATWSRIAVAAVGGAAASSMLTLSSAMAGLSVGAFLSGILLNRLKARDLLIFVITACAAALLAMPWLLLQVNAFEGSLALRRALCALLLILAHLPFGALLPAVTVCRGVRNNLGLDAGDLYAAGACGAACGGVLVGEYLAERMALDFIGICMGLVTLANLGWLYLVPKESEALPAAIPSKARALPTGALLAIAFALGLLGIAAELQWMHALGFYWQATTRSYALVAGSYVAGLSAGSLAARWLLARRSLGPPGLASMCVLAAAALMLAASLSEVAGPASEPAQRAQIALLLVGLPALCFGAAWVCLLECAGSGPSAGRLLAWLCGLNNAGSAMGPLLLWVTVPDLWPARVLACLGAGYLALAAVPWRSRAIRIAMLAAAGGLGVLLALWMPVAPSKRIYLAESHEEEGSRPSLPRDFGALGMAFLRPGRDATVAVTRYSETGVEVLWIDRTIQGDTSLLARRVQERQGQLPCRLLGRRAQRALVIGMGTGITTGGLAKDADSVDVAELSAGVLEANRTILAEANGEIAHQPHVHLCHADGRSVLCDAPQPYDLIVTDIVYPSVPGAGNLFSREFYTLVSRKLATNGLFVHWLPCFQLSSADLSAITAGFLEAFPNATVWIGYLDPSRLILGLASRSPALPEFAWLQFYAFGPRELRELANGAAPIRDADPRLEYRSPPRADQLYGSENLERLLPLLASAQMPPFITVQLTESAWAKYRTGWQLFAKAGQKALEAHTGKAGSVHALEAREMMLTHYYQAAGAAPNLDDARFIIEDLKFERLLAEASQVGASGDLEGMQHRLQELAADPLRIEGNLQLANLFVRKNETELALAELRKAVAKFPRSADAHMKLAMLAFNLKDYPLAKAAFEKASALRTEQPELYKNFKEQFERLSGQSGSE